MARFRIECLNEDGRTTRTLVVSCNTIADAQRLAPAGCEHAILIRPLDAALVEPMPRLAQPATT
jgi:hypothetical protein